MTATTNAGARVDMSPAAKARLAAALFLITMVAGGVAQGALAGSLIVGGNAAATATNIIAHEPLYRLAFALYLVEMSCQVAMTVLFFQLLEPVSRSVALVTATFGLVGCTIKTLSRLFFFAPLLVLGGAPWLGAFDPTQLQAVALLLLRVQYVAETIAMVFFGVSAIAQGYLLFRSTFVPRILGAMSVLGGLGWLIYLYEPLAARLESAIVGTGAIGALALVVWLLVKGVDERLWNEQAAAAAASIWR